MLYIDSDNTIHLTRGDSARLTVPITNEDTGEEYSMTEGDTITLTMKKRAIDETILMQKVVTGDNKFYIKPNDTEGIAFGKYVYDVQLTTEGGDIFTVIEPSTFEILKEVTW